MQLAPLVFVFSPYPNRALGPEGKSAITQLGNLGFSAWNCTSLRELYGAIQRKALNAHPPCSVILNGSHSDNCNAARYLRTLYPGLGIVAQTPSMAESYVIEAIRSGADVCCARTASSQLLAAMLFRLLQRDAVSAEVSSAAVDTGRAWALEQQGWVLVSPEGTPVPLTTGERAFVGALINSPEMRARHAELFAAVYGRQQASPERGSGLGVLVSRMRRKFDQQGVKLPLKSVHNWGYMFAAPVHDRGVLVKQVGAR
jgi:DNA-binding response OmpR family regulator